MFQKMVAIEPVKMEDWALKKLGSFSHDVVFYDDRPKDNEEIIRRIGSADAVLVRHTTPIDAQVLRSCRNIKYIGMCCSLYSPESANVDILEANRLGMVVKGIRDYGDEGVPEYVISELVRFLHGFGPKMWKKEPTELTGLDAGIIGLGTTGLYNARALKFFGANVFYYSRTRKKDVEEKEGFTYLPLDDLLKQVEIVCTCLTKNTVVLGARELDMFTGNKILVNTSIGPGHDINALSRWLDQGNFAFCDTKNGLDPSGALADHAHVFCPNKSAGMTVQTTGRLSKKVIENIESYFAEQNL